MGSPPSPGEVADRLHSVAIHLLRQLRREDEATGLSTARLSALSVVVFAGPLSVGELAGAEQVRSPTMSRVVADLEALGLVTRTMSTTDGRSVEVSATAKGRRVLQAGRRRRVATLSQRLDGLSARDLAVLDRAATLLEQALATPPGAGRR
ncbi:MAG: MarR family transcriptional regulator [Actinomycetota bacterium]|nr:MarR family transcriptional regulator [Actinomycetota bacterium]